MAASNQFQDLKNEATCSICLEYFKDPVIVSCGHNFCHSCITQYLQRSNENWLCPQCRHELKVNFLPNRQLGNIVEMLKQQELNLCEKHKQPQQLFCEEDLQLICLICRESKDHKSHTVSPIDEAAQEYKVKLQNWLCPLKKELQTILEFRLKKEDQCESTRDFVSFINKSFVTGSISASLKATCITPLLKKTSLERADPNNYRPITNVVFLLKIINKVAYFQLQDYRLLGSASDLHIAMRLAFWIYSLINYTHLKVLLDLSAGYDVFEPLYIVEQIMLENEKQKIVDEIQRLRQLLKEKEQTLNQKMEAHEKISTAGNAAVARLSNQSNYLNIVITEIEQKCKAPAWELLKDIRSTLSRCNVVKFQKLLPDMNFKSKAKPFHHDKIQKSEEKMKPFKVMVILDNDTAHCNLCLCLSRRRVKWTDLEQTWPDHAKRFTNYPCVLGSRGFTSGRYFWEVQLLHDGIEWHVGVSSESVSRKEEISWSPDGKVWAVRQADGQYWALTSRDWTLLSLRENPTKLRVCLDCDMARLSVYNAETREHIYTFTNAAFTQRMFPFFALWTGAELNMV